MSKTPKSFFLVPRFFLFSFSCFFQRSLLIIKPYGKSLKSENTTKYLKSMLVATAKFHPKETPHSQHQSPCEFLDVKFASMSHRPVSCLPCRMSCVMPRVRGGVYCIGTARLPVAKTCRRRPGYRYIWTPRTEAVSKYIFKFLIWFYIIVFRIQYYPKYTCGAYTTQSTHVVPKLPKVHMWCLYYIYPKYTCGAVVPIQSPTQVGAGFST